MRVLPVLRLCRIEYVGFGYLALLGAFAERGDPVPVSSLVALLVANMLFVAWTFAHNDLCDLEVDRRAGALDERVLVRGDLGPRDAKVLIAVLISVMLLVSLRFAGFAAAAAFAAASLFAIGYDLISKRVLGSDLLFAASAGCLVLAGVFCATGSFAISPLGAAVVAVYFVEATFFNAIGGGLKDVVTDRRAGAVTLAQRFVRVDGESIAIAPSFRILAVSLKATSFAIAVVSSILHGGDDVGLQLVMLALSGAAAIGFAVRLVTRRRYDWFAMAKDLMPIEMASRLFAPILLFDRIGWIGLAAFFFLPAAWYLGFAKLVHARGFALPKRF